MESTSPNTYGYTVDYSGPVPSLLNNRVPEINQGRYNPVEFSPGAQPGTTQVSLNQRERFDARGRDVYVDPQARQEYQEFLHRLDRERSYARYLDSIRDTAQSPISPRRFHFRQLARKKKRDKKTVSKYQIQSEFIGLKHLAYCLGWRANDRIENRTGSLLSVTEDGREVETGSRAEYKLARDIDPSHEFVNNEGIMWEHMGLYQNAEFCYLMAIEHSEDTLAMYNLGDLYEKEYIGKGTERWPDKTHLAIKYFEMAAHLGDPKAISKSILHYFKAFEETDRNVGYLILKLAEYFVIMVEQEEIAKSMNYPGHIFDRYVSNGFMFSEEREANYFRDFVERQTNLVMILQLEKMRDNTNTYPKEHKYQTQINKYLKSLYKLEDYQAYKNKMKLFTDLNNVTECPVCMEEKVNIDIWCGHAFCGDCYARIYKKECPLCRTYCGFRTHHKTA